MSTTPHLEITKFEEGQSNGDITFNEFARDVDSLVFLSVKDRHLTAPPGGEAEGDRYFVAAGATGTWSGHDGDIAVYYGGAYFFRTPVAGWILQAVDEGKMFVLIVTTWTEIPTGEIRLQVKAPATLAEDVNSDVNILAGATGLIHARVTPHAGSSQIDGIVAPTAETVLFLATTVHTAGGVLSFKDSSVSSSAAANQIYTKDAAQVNVSYDSGIVLIYDFTQTKWRVLATYP